MSLASFGILNTKPVRFSPNFIRVTKLLIHTICFGWVAWVTYLSITDDIVGDPVDALLHFTGMGSLNLLLIGLLITPIAMRFKIGQLIQYRRLIGLYAFFYAVLHLTTFAVFELQLEWALILDEIVERPFITVGFSAFVLLTALATTSFNALKRKMGPTWQRLHNSVYFAAVLVVIHFYWSVKSDIYEPILYALALAILLLFRKHKFLKR